MCKLKIASAICHLGKNYTIEFIEALNQGEHLNLCVFFCRMTNDFLSRQYS